MGSKYNKKILFVLRILLFIAGFSIGFLAIWQVFHSNPSLVKGGLKIIFYAICGLVPGLLLFLSSKPVYLLMRSFGVRITARLNGVKGEDAAGVVLCSVLGIVAAYLCDLLLSLFIGVLALRIIIDFFIGLTVLYVCAVLFFKLIGSELQASAYNAEFERPKQFRGYFITSKALHLDKLLRLTEDWLTGSLYIFDTAVDNCPDEMREKINLMIDNGRLLVETTDENVLENVRAVSIASSLVLKIIVSDLEEAKKYETSNIPILIVSQLFVD